GSEDPDGTTITYKWTSSIQGKIGNDKQFTRMMDCGRHKITLEVTDEDGAAGSTTITIIVKDPTNNDPSVNITAPEDDSWHLTTEEIHLSASGSDPDGHSLSYTWEIEDATYTGKEIDITLKAGDHEVKVFADDGRGGIAEDSIILHINTPPEAVITGLKAKYTDDETITFDASGSSDADNDPRTYIWSSDITGEFYRGKKSKVPKKLTQGEHQITLTVMDNHGGKDSQTLSVTIRSEIDYSITLTAEKTSGTVTYLKPATFIIEGENTGYSDHWVELKNTTLPEGWSASFWSGEEEIDGGDWGLEGPSKKAFEVRIECPRDVTLGDQITIEIRADMGSGIEDRIELDLVV
ncbi:MAG: hypothetical protein KAU14_07210, partial [Thermoplasmata archaeon]|nr:hypothetical protein [Thermoplasmata archaeon]